MTTAEQADAPIYASLVEKYGDVLTEARRVAERTQREATEALDFNRVSPLAGAAAARS